MIAELLPAGVAVAEAYGDPPEASLLPPEAVLVANAVDKRRREFTTGRHLARQALATLGYAPTPVPIGPKREPCWPDGVVGSITHCDGYRAAAVASTECVASLGIDAEPNAPLPSDVVPTVALTSEREMLSTLRAYRSDVPWDRLLFCVKESVYKAWFPLTGRFLDFGEAAVTVDPDAGTFYAQLLAPDRRSHSGTTLERFAGRWRVSDGLVVTAVTVPPNVRC